MKDEEQWLTSTSYWRYWVKLWSLSTNRGRLSRFRKSTLCLKLSKIFNLLVLESTRLCSEFLQTVIASGQGLKGSSPTDMLRKSVSNTSGTSSFSMVGSSMLASQLKQSMSSSGVLVKGNIKRGWDWRRGISSSMKGEDLLRILRLGLAKDLAKAWLVEVDNKM